MIFPTTPLTTKRIDDIKKTLELNDASISTFKTLSRNTAPGSVAGLPGLTLPIGLSPTDGLPVGIAIDGPVNSDERLLSIALALEKILAPMPAPDLK
jgi:Asp-tRNA(Asn)/Glu-tRNA(Gln) amidotransferase A subunit family amidase